MIYPCEENEMQEYAKYIDASKEIWEIQSGCHGRNRKRHESNELKPKPFIVSTASRI